MSMMALRMLLFAVVIAASAVGPGAAAAATGALCDGAKYPIIIIPGMQLICLSMCMAY
jgi:hypothetical protein